jgi:hypothetical protein
MELIKEEIEKTDRVIIFELKSELAALKDVNVRSQELIIKQQKEINYWKNKSKERMK